MSEGGTAFGTLLRQLRTAAALSQEELAERAGAQPARHQRPGAGRSRTPRAWKPCACWPMRSRSARATARRCSPRRGPSAGGPRHATTASPAASRCRRR